LDSTLVDQPFEIRLDGIFAGVNPRLFQFEQAIEFAEVEMIIDVVAALRDRELFGPSIAGELVRRRGGQRNPIAQRALPDPQRAEQAQEISIFAHVETSQHKTASRA
jgi:hypothetical protein